MSTVTLVAKKDGFIQYIDKVLAKKSIDSKKFKIATTNHHRTRRNIFNDKSEGCKALQIASVVAGGVANVAGAASSAASSLPFLGTPFALAASGIAAGYFVAQAAADITYISLDCDSIPFDEIKDIMDKRFNNLDKAVDRNYAALQQVSKLVSRTLSVVEQTRMEMHQGFNQILLSTKESRIEPVLSKLNSFNEYFDTEKDEINGLSRNNYISRIDEVNNVLTFLQDATTPKDDSLRTFVMDIINQKFAIPSGADDIIGVSALFSLTYGTQTYASVMFFLIEQHSYIADYYFQNGDLKKFNDHFTKIQDVFQKFRNTLVGGHKRIGLIDRVINIITEVQAIDFIADDMNLSETLSEKLKELKKLKNEVVGMTLPVIEDTPAKFTGRIKFGNQSITTPIGAWTDKPCVQYAIQYKDGKKYSKVGEWSEPLQVDRQAYPTLRIPVDPKRRTRLIYRKFNDYKPQLVGIVEDKYQTEFHDIHRDLYNAMAWPNTDMAEQVVDILIREGANRDAIFDQGRRALHSGAIGGNPVIAIDKLKPTNINIPDDNGYTAFHMAAEAGNDDMVERLVEKRANVNAQTYAEELTPIHLAALKGYESTVRILMTHPNIDINLDDNEGFTPLLSAATGGLHVVEAILSHPKVDVNRRSNRGLSVLHLTALHGYKDIADALLRTRKLNLNIEGEGKMTPLHFAAIAGHVDMVQFLLDGAADVNVKSVTNWTPLHFAVSLKKVDVASVLVQSRTIELNPKTEDGATPMHIACGSGQIEIVKKILENRSSEVVRAILNTKTKDGLTPLHIAVMKKHTNIVSVLLGKGAAIEAKSNVGVTPLLAAAASGSLDIANILLERGANMYVTDGEKNVLNFAAENGHLDIIQYFVENKGFEMKNGNAVLISAIPKGHLETVKYLVEDKGVSPKCLTEAEMDCPLFVASKYGNLDLFKYIANKQGPIGEFDVLIISNTVQYGHLNLLKYMFEELELSPKINGRDYSAMSGAIKHGWLSIVKYLHEKHHIPFTTPEIASGNVYLMKYLMDSSLGSSALKPTVELLFHVLEYAVPNDKQSLSNFKYLINEKHYDVNVQDKYGRTILCDAILIENLYAVKFLISKGADIHFRGREHLTPLEQAKGEIKDFLQMQDVCNTILKNKVPNIQADYNVNTACIDIRKGFMDDIYHTTALHLAASAGDLNTVNLLIIRGGNVNGKDEEGNTPLHFAVQNENINMINLLVRSRADTSLKNIFNQTPSDLAKENLAMNIVNILRQAQTDRNSGYLTRARNPINQAAFSPAESSSNAKDNLLTNIIEQVCGGSGATPRCLQSSSGNQYSINVRGAECLGSNVSLGILLAQTFLNKKFPLPNFAHVTTSEARGMAATISNKLEKLLKNYVNNVEDLDFYQLYKDISVNIENEQFANVSNVLQEFVKKACGNDVGPVADKIADIF